MSALVDLEEQLLREVLRWSLNTAKTDVRCLHRKNNTSCSAPRSSRAMLGARPRAKPANEDARIERESRTPQEAAGRTKGDGGRFLTQA